MTDFETRAIHEGQDPDPATGAITVPIYQTSTYVQEAVGEHKGYDYARVANPTRTALQLCLASLESAEHGVAFSSGLGAVTTIMHLLNPGDRAVLIADDDAVVTVLDVFLEAPAVGGDDNLAVRHGLENRDAVDAGGATHR